MTISSYFTKLKGLWDELETYRHHPTCNQIKAHNVRSNILMMTPLPNVHQAYSLVIQDETQRKMTLESIENFSIAAIIQIRPNNFSNNSKDKVCEHCNRGGHTIENCRTLKFHCKYCDKRGHTEERCKFKNGAWDSNNTRTQGNQQSPLQQQQRRSHNFLPAANVADFSQSAHGTHLQDVITPVQFSNPLDSPHGYPQT